MFQGISRESYGIEGNRPRSTVGWRIAYAHDRDYAHRHRRHIRMHASDDHYDYDFDDDSGDDHDDKDNNHHEEFDDDHEHKQDDERKVLRNIRDNRSQARRNQTTAMVTTLVDVRTRSFRVNN